MRVVLLAITIAFLPPLLGLVVGTAAFISEASALLTVVAPLMAVWVYVCLPYLSGALPEADRIPGMTLVTAVVITLVQLTIIGASAATVFKARRGLRVAVVAMGTIAASSLVSYALLAALDFFNMP